jgi:hypothetical protein
MPAACSLSIALLYALAAPTADLEWHTNWEAAVKAGGKNNRIAYIFVYLPYRAACNQVDQRTFSNAEVRKRLARFELGGVDASTLEGGAFVKLYKLAWIQEPRSKMRLAVVPAHIFFSPDGTVLHRQYGFIAAAGFAALLDRVDVLRHSRAALRQNPRDARAAAECGHTLLLLGQTDEGRRYLEMAIGLDPENAAGAAERARLDLAILTMKTDPDLAVERLRRWLDTYGQSPLRLEARFYLATAYVVAGDTAQADAVLAPFVNARKGSPEADSDWGARARKLYKEIHKSR